MKCTEGWSTCNRGWSDDEAHFRSVLLLAGEPNEAVQELWTTKTARSFELKESKNHDRNQASRFFVRANEFFRLFQ